jgi:hypothetical protein
LPAAASDLVGRTTAVRHLRDLLSAYRLVTLTGPGGIGKTSVCTENLIRVDEAMGSPKLAE